MQQAATDSVPISPMLASDVPHPASSSPSSSSPFDQYKANRRNASMLMRQSHGGMMRTRDIHDQAESSEHRRCQHISRGIDPSPWMAGMIDLKKEKDFFQTRVIDTGWSIRAWVMALAPA
jgi:hypothetical protein